ncbi:hypothetical protein BDV96DRAFT_109786 [Lophiotrema nucula]|uniref:Zn(2)-C6 fungal-type domain-containing protein n=1 Tax=Lophiotrema nucula TaxID=690887 RepID=A0A6A5Z4T5_9PLEO|nr:hypothetical protein BDV96DRAFT_109786 [Lophiotrema nucula]
METPTSATLSAARTALEESPKIKRAHQACLHCRKRKSRCLLDVDGSIPCLRCKRDNLDCVLGGSNRGGRRVRKKPTDSQTLPSLIGFGQEEGPFHSLGNVGTSPWMGSNGDNNGQEVRRDSQLPRSGTDSSDEIPFPDLQNPSDALGILARVAGESSSGENESSANGHGKIASVTQPMQLARPSQYTYPLLDSGTLSTATVCQLIQRYQQNYHPFYPLVPAHVLDTSRLRETAKKEPQLLTAVLVISSKDLVEEPHIYDACAAYMKKLVSDLAAGGDADLGAVEALLILAEWAPYTQRSSGKVGKGEEDKESWMHVGVALRIAYYLALDGYSFRNNNDGKDPNHSRKRLIWTAAYVSDRHISIRMGKAFWSRGPGPMMTLRREDFPSLIPKNPNEEDYASIFQANLELTQLFSNVHDVLYANPTSSFRSHLSGSYIKFIDDFRSAIYGWKSVWGTLTCSPPLKACLLMSYDYLRLYTNAFAFQATVRRALPAVTPSSAQQSTLGGQPSITMQAPQRVFCNNVGAVGDARFIYEGLDAAKAILTTANNFVDPEKTLRYLPLRYYLYLVYAGVFLYRARCTGVISGDEDRAIRAMINETVARLQRSSVGSGTIAVQHPGSRYSQLLKLLWAKVPRKDKTSRTYHHPGTHVANTPLDAIGHAFTPNGPLSAQTPSQAGSAESPAITEHMGDFGWTDLSAVGDFAINGSGGAMGPVDESALWSGFLPLDMGWGTGFGGSGLGWDNGGFDSNELGMAF